MSLGNFSPSTCLSLGIELELQLINLNNFDLIPASPDLIYLLSQKEFPGAFTPEGTEGMIEINTSIHATYKDCLAQLQEIRDILINACDKLNIGICGGGTHPFQKWSDQKTYPKPRYKNMSALYGYLAKQFTIFGEHIHIGCISGNDALYLLHALNRYVPHFIALAASSPFVQGIDTLFNSARLNTVFAFPLSGHAPYILDWEDFDKQYFTKMYNTGIIRSMKDFYWDIRPKPEYGTIELRVCDTPLTVEKAAALAGYLQALCCYLLEKTVAYPKEDDYLLYNYNRFQACRFGFDGAFIHPQSMKYMHLHDDILFTLNKIKPYAEKLGSMDAINYLIQSVTDNNDAHYLRQQYQTNSNIKESIVEKSISCFRKLD